MSAAPPFRHTVRVYWEDTDAGGIVYYANYLKYLERSRTEWLRSLGVEQQALRASSGAIFVVSDARLRYFAPARLDDQLQVSAEPAGIRKASMTIVQRVLRDTELLAEGEIRIGCVDALTLRPRRFPESLTKILQ